MKHKISRLFGLGLFDSFEYASIAGNTWITMYCRDGSTWKRRRDSRNLWTVVPQYRSTEWRPLKNRPWPCHRRLGRHKDTISGHSPGETFQSYDSKPWSSPGRLIKNVAELLFPKSFPLGSSIVRLLGVCIWLRIRTMSRRYCGDCLQYPSYLGAWKAGRRL